MDITAAMNKTNREIFCCYAHKDQLLLRELETHLTPLQREEHIPLWADTNINAGAKWEKVIKHHLNTAQIVLLLISPDFMASKYCYDIEMKQAIERHDRLHARIIPIILRPSDWKKAPFAHLQVLPREAKPITKWDDRDEAFLDVVEGIRKAVEELRSVIVPTSPQPEQSLPPQHEELRSVTVPTSPQPEQSLPPQHPATHNTTTNLSAMTSSSLVNPLLSDQQSTLALRPSTQTQVSTTNMDNSTRVAPRSSLRLETVPGTLQPREQKMRGENWEALLTVLIFLGVFAAFAGVIWLSYQYHTASVDISSTSPPIQLIQHYCDAMKRQNYSAAYSYFDAASTISGQNISDANTFTQKARQADQQGHIVSCTVKSGETVLGVCSGGPAGPFCTTYDRFTVNMKRSNISAYSMHITIDPHLSSQYITDIDKL